MLYHQAKMFQQILSSISRRFGFSGTPAASSGAPVASTVGGTRVGAPSPAHRGGAMATKGPTTSASKGDAESTALHLGPRVSWDPSDGEINAENMCAAFSKAGYPLTRVLNFPAGHAMKDHAHNKKGNKRVGIAAGGKFCIRPKPEGAGSSSSLSDVELSPGESVDIPPGLVHCAWVVGDQGVTFIMGDRKEE